MTGIAWRHLNLELPPFSFPPPVLLLPDGSVQTNDGSYGTDKMLAIWNVSEVRALRGLHDPARPTTTPDPTETSASAASRDRVIVS